MLAESRFSYIYEALDLLGISRIDHGVQSNKSAALMQHHKESKCR